MLSHSLIKILHEKLTEAAKPLESDKSRQEFWEIVYAIAIAEIDSLANKQGKPDARN